MAADQVQACVLPLKVSNVTLDNGHVARGVALKAGGQSLAFRIDSHANITYAYGSNCLRNYPPEKCVTFRGGLYRQLASETRGRVNESLIPPDDDGRERDWGSDILTLNDNDNITDFPLAVPLSEIGGDQSYAPMNPLGLGSNSSVLNMLHAAGRIPSRTWSYFYGRVGATSDVQFDGSIILGGFDRANTQGENITRPLAYTGDCPTGLPINITNMTMNFPNGTELGIFTKDEPMVTCLDPGGVALMAIPLDGVFQNFYDAAGVGLDIYSNAGRSFGNNYYTMLYDNDTVSYKGDISIEIDGKLTIRIPNDQLVIPELTIADSGEILANTTRPNLLINSLQSDTANVPPSLGRAFFAALSLMVNYDSGDFTIWQARATHERELVPIAEDNSITSCLPGASNTPPPPSEERSNQLSGGAIGGIVVGGIAGIALIALLVFFVIRRRRTAAPKQPDSVVPDMRASYYAPPQPKFDNLSPQVPHPHEIDSVEAFQPSPVELPAAYPR